MKFQFLHALLVPDRGRDLRISHSAALLALTHTTAGSNAAPSKRVRLVCRWQQDPVTRRLEAHWSTRE